MNARQSCSRIGSARQDSTSLKHDRRPIFAPLRVGEALLTKGNEPTVYLLYHRLDNGLDHLAGVCGDCADDLGLVQRAAKIAGVDLKTPASHWGNA